MLMTGCVIPCIYALPEKFTFQLEQQNGTEFTTIEGSTLEVTRWTAYGCIIFGLWSGMIIGFTTEYFTSNNYGPTLLLAESCKFGPAPNII